MMRTRKEAVAAGRRIVKAIHTECAAGGEMRTGMYGAHCADYGRYIADQGMTPYVKLHGYFKTKYLAAVLAVAKDLGVSKREMDIEQYTDRYTQLSMKIKYDHDFATEERAKKIAAVKRAAEKLGLTVIDSAV